MEQRAAIDIASRARVEILVTIVNIQIEMANCANPRTAGLYVKVRIGVGHTSDMCFRHGPYGSDTATYIFSSRKREVQVSKLCRSTLATAIESTFPGPCFPAWRVEARPDPGLQETRLQLGL